MFVCVCHGYNEKCVSEAVDGGPATLAEVYRRLGEQPRCGKCVPDVLRMYHDRRGKDADGDAPAAHASI
ncbi:MAG: bacterioferritin-associated ferredoxin [Gemmatimonas sp.]